MLNGQIDISRPKFRDGFFWRGSFSVMPRYLSTILVALESYDDIAISTKISNMPDQCISRLNVNFSFLSFNMYLTN